MQVNYFYCTVHPKGWTLYKLEVNQNTVHIADYISYSRCYIYNFTFSYKAFQIIGVKLKLIDAYLKAMDTFAVFSALYALCREKKFCKYFLLKKMYFFYRQLACITIYCKLLDSIQS